jgi:L-aminopeptidase/D-esterase-like protein
MRYSGSITDIPGLLAGHYTDQTARTGCTVVIAPTGAVGGVDVRGAAPGTRETDLLKPGNLVEKVNAIILCGGSAYGLAAADGVMHWCEEQGYGLDVGVAKVPIVSAAVLFDLGVGTPHVRPDAKAGYAACQAAGSDPLAQGRIGAGTGCTVGKALGGSYAMPGGLGTASIRLPSGVTVAAVMAVNALGDVFDHHSGIEIAGARNEEGVWLDLMGRLTGGQPSQSLVGVNTTIGIVATDAALDKAQVNRLATVAHDGYALTIRPVHTMNDGDALFALSLGDKKEDMTVLCAAAVEVVARAIVNAAVAGSITE